MRCPDYPHDRCGDLPPAAWRRWCPLAALCLIVATIAGWTIVGRSSHDTGPRIVDAMAGEVWIGDAPMPQDDEFVVVRPAGFASELVDAPVFGELLDGCPHDLPNAMGAACEACQAAASDLPRELHLRPDYIIDPPDILLVDVQAGGSEQSLADEACGERLVNPDGRIDLGETLGSVEVGGSRLDEAPARILDVIRAVLPNAEVEVSVFAQNSKVYYVILEGGKDGDLAARFPVVGDETIKDVLDQVRDMVPEEPLEQKHLWVARPQAGGQHSDTILPIDLSESPDGGELADCPIEPGDRLFVATPPDFWQTVGVILATTWQALSENPGEAPLGNDRSPPQAPEAP